MSRERRLRSADTSVRALALLGRWNRVSQGHLSLGARCSCLGGGSVLPSELEDQVLAYVESRHTDPPLAALIAQTRGPDAAASRPPAQTGVSRLLGALARSAASLDSRATGALLEDLERTIASFEEAHRLR